MASKAVANGVTPRRGQLRPGYGYLTCELAPAPSSDETLMFVDRLGGGRVAALVNRADVRTQGPVRTPQRGEVLVTVLQKVVGGFLIELPSEPINFPARVPVPENAVNFPE